VDAPDMVRCQINFKRLALTDIKIDIPKTPKKKTLVAAMEAAGVMPFPFSEFAFSILYLTSSICIEK
jgi:Ribosomal protein L14